MNLLTLPQNTESKYRHVPKEPPSAWGLAVGAWGDCLACLGNFQAMVGRGGLIYYGRDHRIAGFLARQEGVQAVRPLLYGDDTEGLHFVIDSLKLQKPEIIENMASICEILPTQIHRTDAEFSAVSGRPVYRPKRIRLPWLSKETASHVMREIYTQYGFWHPTMIFNPYSLHITPPENHWAHWQRALDFLLTYTPYHVVLVGQGYEVEREHPRLTNLLGKTDSMEDVFALANVTDAIVTTSNSLALYAASEGLPCVTVANEPFARNGQCEFFYRFCDVPSTSIVEYGGSVADFVGAFAKRFPI